MWSEEVMFVQSNKNRGLHERIKKIYMRPYLEANKELGLPILPWGGKYMKI